MTIEHPHRETKEITSIKIYIDGICPQGFWEGGAAFVRQDFVGNKMVAERELSVHIDDTSMREIELTALRNAIIDIPSKTPTLITSDDGYLTGAVNKYWDTWVANGMKNAKGKPIKYKEHWEEIHGLLKGKDIKLQWVGGGNIHPLKPRVDALAQRAFMGTTVDRDVFKNRNQIVGEV
jgi:ribonuclease HI